MQLIYRATDRTAIARKAASQAIPLHILLESHLQMKNPIVAIQNLYNETTSELKKCSWPSRQELYESTVVVVSSLIILSLFVSIADWLFEGAVRYITGSM